MPTALQIVQRFYPQVKKVITATTPVTVEIDKRDVKNSTPKDHKSCAMAEACKRKMDVDGAIISTRTAYLIKGDKAIRYSVPEYAAREIVAFDRGAGFATGTYKLGKGPKAAPHGQGKRKQSWDRRAGKIRHRANHKTEGVRSSLLRVDG